MVLSDGRVAYWGPASESIDYFSKIGRPMPKNMNPAEYMLDLVNRDFTDAKEVEAVINEWVKRGPIVSKAKVLEQPRSFHSTGLGFRV
jgi:flagellar basal body P-ring protein FlgI